MEHPNPNQNRPKAVSKLVQDDQKMSKNHPKMTQALKDQEEIQQVQKWLLWTPFFQKLPFFANFGGSFLVNFWKKSTKK